MYIICCPHEQGPLYWHGKFYGSQYAGYWTPDKQHATLYKTYPAAARIVTHYLPVVNRTAATITDDPK
jgi:hypothetical protein